MYRPLGWISEAPCRQGGCPDAADGSLLNGMKANISEADVSLNAVHEAEGSASGQPPPRAQMLKQLWFMVGRMELGENSRAMPLHLTDLPRGILLSPTFS